MKRILLLLPSLFLGLNAVSAELPPVVLKAQVDKALVKASDSVTYTITLNVKKEFGTAQVPEIGDGIAGFRIVDFGTIPPKIEDDRLVASRWYKLQGDIAGSYILPALQLNYKDEKGTEQSAKTGEIFVEVQSDATPAKDDKTASDPAAAKDIRDIKDIVPAKTAKWVWWLLASSITVVISFFAYRYWKKQKPPQIFPEKLPHEIALEKLQQLSNNDWLASGRAKEFHFQLSDIARMYFEKRYDVPASDRTTEELQTELKTFSGLDASARNQFIELIQKMDVVKFTDSTMSEDQSSDILNQIRKFVETTKPQDMAPPPPPSDKLAEDRVI